jgi:hypothetical protein
MPCSVASRRPAPLATSLRLAVLPFLAVLLAVSSASAQQTVTLTGVVLDAASGEPVRGAFVSVGETGPRAVADSLGAFRLAGVATGSQTLLGQRFGYLDAELTLTVTDPPGPFVVRMVADPLAIEGLVVTGGARVAMSGTVVNAVTGEPVPWADLELTQDIVRAEARAYSDERGVFRLPETMTGRYLLRVDRLGYESQYLAVAIGAPPEPIEVRLQPDSALLAGVERFQRELRSRRNASPFIVRQYDEAALRYSRVAGMRQFLENYAFLSFFPCGVGDDCVLSRGREVRPSFVIDELVAYGGLAQLDSYRPEEFHSVEVSRCGSAVSVRAYTYAYVERQALRPRLMFSLC